MKPRRVQFREHLEAHPEVRFEDLDPIPMEEAVIPPRPQRMSDLVAQYVRMQQLQVPDGGTDLMEVDPDEQLLTDHQFVAMAVDDEEYEAFFAPISTPAEPESEEKQSDSEPAQQAQAPQEPAQEPLT